MRHKKYFMEHSSRKESMNKQNTLIIILIVSCFIVLIPLIILLGIASWSPDDYSLALAYKNNGLSALPNRLLQWSPRPLSDLIIYIYLTIVNWIEKPLIGIFLMILWMIFGFSLYIALINIIKNESNNELLEQKDFESSFQNNSKFKSFQIDCQLISVLLTLFLFIYYLFIVKPTQIFYWPAGAAPYILSAAGLILEVSTLIKLSKFSFVSYFQTFSLVIFAILTAFSSEVGSLYQLLLSLSLLSLLISILIWGHFNRNYSNLFAFSWNTQSLGKLFIAASISCLLSSTILFVLNTSRVGKPELNSLSSPITGNLKSSIILAMQQFLKEVFFLNDTSLKIDSLLVSFSYALACKLGLLLLVIFLGMKARICWKKSTNLLCIILVIILMATNFLTITASAYQFGEICCLRHLHFRAIVTGLSILLIGFMIASMLNYYLTSNNTNLLIKKPVIPLNKSLVTSFIFKSDFFTLLMMTMTLILLVNLQSNAIINDLKNYDLIYSLNKENWGYNISHKDLSGKYINPPFAEYSSVNFLMPTGVHLRSQDNLEPHVATYMSYFNKEKLSVYSFEQDGSN